MTTDFKSWDLWDLGRWEPKVWPTVPDRFEGRSGHEHSWVHRSLSNEFQRFVDSFFDGFPAYSKNNVLARDRLVFQTEANYSEVQEWHKDISGSPVWLVMWSTHAPTQIKRPKEPTVYDTEPYHVYAMDNSRWFHRGQKLTAKEKRERRFMRAYYSLDKTGY